MAFGVTIGIAAFGPNAGLAVVRALSAVEAVGRGAIGGFVSLVALADGAVLRAETQRGGTAGLFRAWGAPELPDALARATAAGLMSSGPDRPTPLSQFTPADPAVGLVTGHRMPNTPGRAGPPVNEEVLALMRRGAAPDEAVAAVLADNPGVDAGMIALALDGRVGLGNTALVERRGDLGTARAGSVETGAVACALHNAILPHRPIAALAAETALDAMQPRDKVDAWATLRAGIPIRPGPARALVVDAAGLVTELACEDEAVWAGGDALRSFGLGHEPGVMRAGRLVGRALYEPYMLVRDGVLVSADGAAEQRLPLRLVSAS